MNIFRKKLNQTGFDHIFMAVAFVVVMGIVGAGYVVINGHSTKGVSHAASGGYGHTFCFGGSYGCLNAYGGGSWVDVYNSTHVGNDDFYSVSLTNNASTYIMDSGANAQSGNCIGDAYNNPSNPLVSLDSCPGSSKGAGWGTYFQVDAPTSTNHVCPAGSVAFKNKHSGQFLAPVNGYQSANGSHFRLNGTLYCFKVGPAV